MAPTTRQTAKRLRDKEPTDPPTTKPRPPRTKRRTQAAASVRPAAASQRVRDGTTKPVVTRGSGPTSILEMTPRCAKTAISLSGAGVGVVSTPGLLGAILDFVPVRPTNRGVDAAAFLTTIASVRQAFLPLGSVVKRDFEPSNQQLWRRKLFEYFDFSIKSKSALNFSDDIGKDVSQDKWVRRDKALAAKRRRRYFRRQQGNNPGSGDNEEMFLEEDFQLWSKLDIYHRPSHYRFLTEIQDGSREANSFPDSVDAFELFQDLVIAVNELRRHALVTDPVTKKVSASQYIFPCLLRRMPKKVTPRGSDLLDVCGWSPEFWDSGYRMVSTPWEGLSTPALKAITRARYSADADATELVLPDPDVHEELGGRPFFVGWDDNERAKLEAFIEKRLCDWRCIRVSTIEGPQFFIGKREKTNRWMGFITTSPQTW